jgi:hypothetical protein
MQGVDRDPSQPFAQPFSAVYRMNRDAAHPPGPGERQA